ncbi:MULTISPECIES: TRAP transporter substrate-binding protein DctP [Cobetia]|uniref:C4-dicarboxylate ABC transporter substrate-binding protein n=1 Tax=Cobetia crustatorum TaxID=553385 RepID=A0A558HKC0_9GAMM|nr:MULTISPECIES: TRAP transporter substrate-binding protein DctP [Cobetia]TVU69580.1 C4-dicarboxylate ABC transporter substrate-binding protein [Cobetia crustatorum]
MKTLKPALLLPLFALLPATSAMATELRMLASYDQTSAYSREIAQRFIKEVEANDTADLSIKLTGPDVVSPFEQLQPVAAGVFQLLYTHAAYHTNTTGVGAAMDAIKVNPEQTRESGLWDLVDEHYQTLGLKLISIPPLGSSGFQYVLKKPIEGSPGLDGRRLRGSPTYTNVTKGMGGTPVLMSSGDVYSAMDRGVIDGAAWGLNGVKDMGWQEVAGYFSKPTFGQTYNFVLMNLNAFNSLSPEQQQVLLDQGRQLETEIAPVMDKLAIDEWKSLEAAGMQPTEFSPEDASRLDALVTDGIWQLGIDKTPETVTAMRKLAIEKNLTTVSE